MKLLVTAFGPFDGRSENASSLALRGLELTNPEILTEILPVDSIIAPAMLKEALDRHRPDALIMLGEAAGSSEIRLETTAWNLLDFSIPDNAGRQPRSRLIIPNSFPSILSSLPLEGIHEALTNLGHSVRMSDNPGRYLCNQLFYVARHFLEESHPVCRAGFIHLPLARDYPTERAVHALQAILKSL